MAAWLLALALAPGRMSQRVELARPAEAARLVDDRWIAKRTHLQALAAVRATRSIETGAGEPASPLRADGPVYRLPAPGPLLPEPGDRIANGLLIGARSGAVAIAPATGRVAYAGRFRRYGRILILDHGHGWTSIVTGLSSVDVPQGATLTGGDPIGRTGGKVRLRLLHHGRAVDIVAIVAQVNG